MPSFMTFGRSYAPTFEEGILRLIQESKPEQVALLAPRFTYEYLSLEDLVFDTPHLVE